VTRPLPPWWVRHVIGVLLWQAALWFGYLSFTARLPVGDSMLEATIVPLQAMGYFPLLSLFVALCVAGLAVASNTYPSRRSLLVISGYGLVAGYWCYAWLVALALGAC
jgi:hypothetical protein